MSLKLLLDASYGATVHCYSPIDERHSRTGEWECLWGEVLPTFAQLVVCELPDEPGIRLLGLTAQGHVQFDSALASITDAKHYAEVEYRGVSSTWQQPMGVSNASDA